MLAYLSITEDAAMRLAQRVRRDLAHARQRLRCELALGGDGREEMAVVAELQADLAELESISNELVAA